MAAKSETLRLLVLHNSADNTEEIVKSLKNAGTPTPTATGPCAVGLTPTHLITAPVPSLAHGSMYMVGAFVAAWLVELTGSFLLGVVLAVPLTALFGMAMESTLLRTLYARDHLSQVLATFALILILNESVRMIWGSDLPLSAPAALAGPVELMPGLSYPAYRLLIIAVGLVLALALYGLVAHTRVGALVRAGASNREMAMTMGVNIPRLFTAVFGVGAALCAVAGALLGPLFAVQVGMGESIPPAPRTATPVGTPRAPAASK